MSFMDARQRADLDRHITGNYGEDQTPESTCIVDFCGRDAGSGLPATFSADYFPEESLTYFTGDWGSDIPVMPSPEEPTEEQVYAWARSHGGIW